MPHREVLQAQFLRFHGQTQVGVALEQVDERDFGFHACQRRTQTEVNAVPKTQMLVRCARNVEHFRSFKDGRVMIGCAEQRHHR